MNTLAKLARVFGLALTLFLPAAPASAEESLYSRAELDRLLAPVALYPDTVLSHVLIASTYPLEVVQAARWSRRHPGLRGEEAVDAVEHKDWDASVKALVAFPELLERMGEDLEWTQDLGEAFLAQEGEVMDSVQGLRRRAYEAGNLESMEHVRVLREREVIYIEPALSHVVYVPYYDTRVVYGSWWWPAYPPYCWSYWGGRPASHYGHGFYWGLGFHVAPTFYFSAFHWPARHVVVVHRHHRSPQHHFGSGQDVVRHENAHRWRHDTHHRRGVAYRSERLKRDHGVRGFRETRPEPAAPERRSQPHGPKPGSTARPARERREAHASLVERPEKERASRREASEPDAAHAPEQRRGPAANHRGPSRGESQHRHRSEH